MGIKYERKSYLFCSILESAVVRSEMEFVLRCENYVQVDFTMLCVVWLLFHCWCHAPVVIIVSRFILVINLSTIFELTVGVRISWKKGVLEREHRGRDAIRCLLLCALYCMEGEFQQIIMKRRLSFK